jgi:1,2-phenylacetyl-CoA epoxidase PaaB subunit
MPSSAKLRYKARKSQESALELATSALRARSAPVEEYHALAEDHAQSLLKLDINFPLTTFRPLKKSNAKAQKERNIESRRKLVSRHENDLAVFLKTNYRPIELSTLKLSQIDELHRFDQWVIRSEEQDYKPVEKSVKLTQEEKAAMKRRERFERKQVKDTIALVKTSPTKEALDTHRKNQQDDLEDFKAREIARKEQRSLYFKMRYQNRILRKTDLEK